MLVDQGVDGLALRAVAREMGMTAPALYRYFASREDLVEHVVADLYAELVRRARGRPRRRRSPATSGVAADGGRPARSAPGRLTHHAEFGLLFGSAGRESSATTAQRRQEGPASAAAAPVRGDVRRPGRRRSTWSAASRSRPTTSSSPPLQEQLRPGARSSRAAAARASCTVFLSCWIRLYGMVCMEVFGHLRFALDDAEPMFEAELRALGERARCGEDTAAAELTVPPTSRA